MYWALRTNCFVETRIGTLSENFRLIFVLQIILDVSHFMVNCNQIFHVDSRTLLDALNRCMLQQIWHNHTRFFKLPEILSVAKIPRGCVTDHLSAGRLLDDRLTPEFRRHRNQTKPGEEFVGFLEHFLCRVALLVHFWCDIDRNFAWVRDGDIQNVAPCLRPHIAQ